MIEQILFWAHRPISANYPSISELLLTGGLVPEDSIIKLIEGLSEVVPISPFKAAPML
jgi:phosphate acetyltransferase